MKGALACYVEAVRALQRRGRPAARRRDDRRRVRRDREDAVRRCAGAEYRGYAAGSALPRLARRRRRHVPARRADGGQGRARALRLALAADLGRTATSSTRRSPRASATRTRSCACSEVLDAVLGVDPDLGGRSRERLPRREGDRQRRRDRGGLRLARVADAASHRPVPRRARAADEGDGRRAPAGARHGARAGGAVSRLRRRGRGVRHRARRRDRRGARARAAIDAAHEEVFGEVPGARRDTLVLRCVRADPLRDPDGQLRHLDRADGLDDGENLEIDGLVQTAEVYARVAMRSAARGTSGRGT